MTFSISVTIIDKVSKSNYEELKLGYCNESDTVLQIKVKIADTVDKDHSKIVVAYKGSILSNNQLTLKQCDLIPSEFRQTPKIFVTFRKSPKIRTKNTPETKSNAPEIIESSNNNNNINTENDEEKTCRICFCGEDIPGQLFSPCRCTGTMKYIHVECLNRWRATAPTETSYYKCDQCLYEYNLVRTYWAKILEKEIISKIITILLLIIGIFITGFISKILYIPVSDKVFYWIEWNPVISLSPKICKFKGNEYWEDICGKCMNSWNIWGECAPICYNICGYVDENVNEYWIIVWFNGLFIVGLIGLILIREMIWRHKEKMILMLLQSTRILRLYLLVGLGHAFWGLYNIVRVSVKIILFKFGERILDVQ